MKVVSCSGGLVYWLSRAKVIRQVFDGEIKGRGNRDEYENGDNKHHRPQSCLAGSGGEHRVPRSVRSGGELGGKMNVKVQDMLRAFCLRRFKISDPTHVCGA